MRKAPKFTLGPRPTADTGRLPKRAPKIESGRSRATTSQLDATEQSGMIDPELGSPERRAMPRVQLELEYQAALQERDVVLHELAACLKDLMVTVPPD
jgi:hypothetical protein